jgi:hypothetical protein
VNKEFQDTTNGCAGCMHTTSLTIPFVRVVHQQVTFIHVAHFNFSAGGQFATLFDAAFGL